MTMWYNAWRLFPLFIKRVYKWAPIHQYFTTHALCYPYTYIFNSICTLIHRHGKGFLCCWALGPDSIQRYHLTNMGNPIVEIRRYYDRLISTMGFPILVRIRLYIESVPCMLPTDVSASILWLLYPMYAIWRDKWFIQYHWLIFSNDWYKTLVQKGTMAM